MLRRRQQLARVGLELWRRQRRRQLWKVVRGLVVKWIGPLLSRIAVLSTLLHGGTPDFTRFVYQSQALPEQQGITPKSGQLFAVREDALGSLARFFAARVVGGGLLALVSEREKKQKTAFSKTAWLLGCFLACLGRATSTLQLIKRRRPRPGNINFATYKKKATYRPTCKKTEIATSTLGKSRKPT